MSQQLHPADKPLLRLGAYLGGFVAFFAFAVLGLLIAKAPIRTEEPSFLEQTAQARKDVAAKISAADTEALSVPAVVDEGAGVARLPIVAAKEVVLEDLKKLKAKKSAIPLPGSEAATKLMQQQSAPPAEEKKPEKAAPKDKPKAAAKPKAAEPKKANTEKKPQPKKADPTPKSVPAETQKKPAAKPETPAKPSNPQG